MDVTRLSGVELAHQIVGTGEPVVLLHARPFVDWYLPLLPHLADRALLQTRREVDPNRLAAGPPYGLADDAAAIEQLLGHVGIERPHLVGHSYGGLLALELARRGNIDIRSLALLEPASGGFLPPERAAAGVAPLLAIVETDGAAAGMHRFLATVCGDSYREELDAAVPSGVETACRHAEQFFRVELRAVAAWEYGGEDAGALTMPVLVVAGTASGSRFIEVADRLQSWIGHAERSDIAGANHLLMAQQPEPVAAALAAFWDRC